MNAWCALIIYSTFNMKNNLTHFEDFAQHGLTFSGISNFRARSTWEPSHKGGNVASLVTV